MNIAVFCGSGVGADPAFTRAAEQVGRTLAERAITIIYGGGHVGLMGIMADSALEAGGTVIGVIPRHLDTRELTHTGLSEVHVVESMHERKTMMADLAHAFLALPGGAGTLEEIAEQWTWAQLGIHDKPSAFLDVKGFWHPMRLMAEQMVDSQFVSEPNAQIVTFDDDLDRLLARLSEPSGAAVKWRQDVPNP